MRIADICKREIVTIDQGASLREAAALMRSRHVGALLVTADTPRGSGALGIVTDRDIAIDAVAQGLDPSATRVGQVASGKLVAVPAGAGIGDAVALMQQAGVRRLVVTEQEGQVAGFLSSDDLLDAVAAELAGLSHALRAGIVREATEHRPQAAAPARPVFLPAGTPGMPWPGTAA